MLDRRKFLLTSAGAALAAALHQKADAAPANADGEWRNKQNGMAYRRLGRTGFMVSEVVMGGLQVKADNWEHVLAAMDMGLNYLDTAVAYGNGKSEAAYANVIKARPRDSFFLNTKVSIWEKNRNDLFQKIFDSLPESEQKKLQTKAQDRIEETRAGEPDYLGMYFGGQDKAMKSTFLAEVMAQKYGRQIDRKKNYKDTIIQSVEESLRRLGTDHLDVVTCPHGACNVHDVRGYPEIFEAFAQLKKDGKARYLGVSTHTGPAEVIDAAIETGEYAMTLAAYNIVNRAYVEKSLERAKKADFGVIVMKAARPVYNGRGAPDDPKRVKLIEDAVPGDLKVPQKAYLWVLRNPNISATISDIGNMDMVKDNVPLALSKS